MAINFLETVKNYFTGEFHNQAANSLGESGSSVSKALSAIIPMGLAGILTKATSGNDGANSVFDMAKNAATNFSASPNLSDLHNDEKGSDIPSGIFGSHQSQIEAGISRFAGIQNSSASSLMTMALPVVMGLLGKHASQNNLNPSGLSGFLSSQKDHIMNAMPEGLSSLGALFGLRSPVAAASTMGSNIKTDFDKTVADNPKGNSKWLLPLIIILAAIALLWYFSRSCNKKTESATTSDSTAIVSADTSKPMAPATTVESIKVKLPNGKELDANKGGIEDQLVTFLNGNWRTMSDSALKDKWFDFDNLNFNTDKATLLPNSEKQLDNIAEILKAFPDAKLKIGGYTDATGNAADNKKLSQARADAAKTGLTKRGVGAQIVSAEGYGSQFAKAAASASDSEKALDRHVSVSVRK
ncbi:MAG: OmpA family protein [Bacteroidota bacterium]|nr:OmpA family protein [Bacteroidota bacterium]